MGQLRTPALVVVAAVAAAVFLAACGGIAGPGAGATAAQQQAQTLTIYSSLPVQGPDRWRQESIVNGEKLALSDAGGRVNGFHLSFASLTDSDQPAGSWTASDTLQAARLASSDRSTIAYIGDFDSPATAISLPLLNEGGILQISPGSSYVGLTEAAPTDGRGEPDRYYPSAGPRTFARLVPSDAVEGRAMVRYMRALHVRRLFVIGDYDVFDANLAAIVGSVAPGAGVPVVGHLTVDTRASRSTPSDYRQQAAAVVAAHADAVVLGSTASAGSEALWQALHAAAPRVKLFAASSLATPAFVAATRAAASHTYVTSPVLDATAYPPAAQRVLRAYRETFGIAPTAYSLYGYEAMALAIAAIRSAGANGGDRASVVRAFFALGAHDSVLGRYAVTPTGDTTLGTMVGYRVDRAGRLVFNRRLRS